MQVDALIPRMYACPIKPTKTSAQCETEQTNESVTPESDTEVDVHHMINLVEQIELIELPLQGVSIRATIKGTTTLDVT
jgi:hypothetical protein